MKLSHSKTEKELIIDQFKHDCNTLGVTEVNFPTNVEDYQVSGLEAIPDVTDNHIDINVEPNTKITITFNDSVETSKSYTSTMNFRRLDLKHILGNKINAYVYPVSNAYNESYKSLETNAHAENVKNKLLSILESCSDSKVTTTYVNNGTHTNFVDGSDTFSVTVNENSMILRNAEQEQFKVKTRDDNIGMLIKLRNDNGKSTEDKRYYVSLTSGESLGTQHEELKTLDLSEGESAWTLFFPVIGMTSLNSGYFTDVSENAAGTLMLSDALPESLTTISTDAFKVTRSTGQELKFKITSKATGDVTEDFLDFGMKTPLHFFKNITHLEANSITKNLVFDSEKYLLFFGNENLQVDDGAFEEGVDIADARFKSLPAMLKAFKTAKFNNAVYEPKHSDLHYQYESDEYEYVGGLVLKKEDTGHGTSETIILFDDDMINDNPNIFTPGAKQDFTPLIKEVHLPGTMTSVPARFMLGCELDTLEIKEFLTVKATAFKDCTIKELIIKGNTADRINLVEGAFTNATIEKITVETEEVKTKVESKLNSLSKVPTWNIKTQTSAGEVPAVVSSSGLNYNSI